MLVPQTARPLATRRQTHPANVVQGVGEGLAADIRVFRIDARTVMYVVRVASMYDDAACRLVGILPGVEPLDLGGLSVAAGSVGCARLSVVPPSGDFEAVYLEIRSPNALMRVEAPRIRPRRKKPLLAVACVITAITASAASAAVLILQQPPQMAAPRVVQAAPIVIPAPPPARVISFSVRRDGSGDGETMLASYMAIADKGNLVLADSRGKVVATAPFTHVGTTRLVIAPQYRSKPLVARLVVHRGSTSAVASIWTLPTLLAGDVPDDGTAPEGVTPLDAVSPRTAFAGMIGAESRAVAGHLLKIRLMPSLNQPHIELQDGSGATLAQRDLPSGATTVTLPLPSAAASRTYYLSLRYVKDGAEETIVRTIVAAAR